jgi:hypothetical protein
MKYKFTCITNGDIHETQNYENYLDVCPYCGNRLLSNRYKDLCVIDVKGDRDDVSIEIAMEYCSYCCQLFIRETY